MMMEVIKLTKYKYICGLLVSNTLKMASKNVWFHLNITKIFQNIRFLKDHWNL